MAKLFCMCSGNGAVTSIVPPRGCGSTRRRAIRCSFGSIPGGTARIGSLRAGSFKGFRLYFGSPTIGWPIASQWARQGETLEPNDMPLTRLLNAAIDGVARAMAKTRAEIVAFAGSDLLCYRAEEPEALAERQRAAFDPVLDWAAAAFRARFHLAAGVMPVAQPRHALEAVRAALDEFDDPATLAALAAMTNLTGSAIIALAVAHGRLTAEEAWRAAHLDEDFQAKRWGVDAEAMACRAACWRKMEAAATVVRLLRRL